MWSPCTDVEPPPSATPLTDTAPATAAVTAAVDAAAAAASIAVAPASAATSSVATAASAAIAAPAEGAVQPLAADRSTSNATEWPAIGSEVTELCGVRLLCSGRVTE